MNEEKILFYASQSLPRYTSYPTAVDFSTDVESNVYMQWLRLLKPKETVSLYLHIPYCQEICHYCGCHTKAVKKKDVVDAYISFLKKEIAIYKSYLSHRLPLSHIHWGGGTPSIIGSHGLLEIIACLKEVFFFPKTLEHAIELDPRMLTSDLADSLLDVGVTRVSFGIQDTNLQVQRAIGRVQPTEIVINALELLRKRGISEINFDLIYGLPYQTLESLSETCKTVVQLNPSRIACFGYAHLPSRRANQRLIPTNILPNARERFAQASLVERLFVESGYVSIGIDHFARPEDSLAVLAKSKQLQRNFQGYTTDTSEVLLGLGASSISKFPQGYAQNLVDWHSYERAITAEKFPIARGYILKDQDKIRSEIIKNLMCYFEVSLTDYAPIEEFSVELKNLSPFISDGLVELIGGVIKITDEGRPFVRAVAVLFDQFRQKVKANFSPAI